jgi:hypothetical protein
MRTLHAWLADGRVERRSRADRSVVTEGLDELDERLAAAEPGLVAVLIAAAKRGSWQAALAILERRFPERWSKPSRSQPVEVALRCCPTRSSRSIN